MVFSTFPYAVFWFFIRQKWGPNSRKTAEWQDSSLEKCHLMALVVLLMCHLWRTWLSDSYFWVMLAYLKQLVLSLRHLSTCTDDVLTGTLSPTTSHWEKLSSCEKEDFQFQRIGGLVQKHTLSHLLHCFKIFKCVNIVWINNQLFFFPLLYHSSLKEIDLLGKK